MHLNKEQNWEHYRISFPGRHLYISKIFIACFATKQPWLSLREAKRGWTDNFNARHLARTLFPLFLPLISLSFIYIGLNECPFSCEFFISPKKTWAMGWGKLWNIEQNCLRKNTRAETTRVPWFMRPRLNTAKSEPLCQFVLRATRQPKTETDSRTGKTREKYENAGWKTTAGWKGQVNN